MTLQLENGKKVSEQQEILNCIRQYYQNLFNNKDNEIEETDLFKVIDETQVSKISISDMGRAISIQELSIVLKKMKNNKTPGIDGISSEFLKVFWEKLKHLICRAINTCYAKGQMSPSMRQCIITCLPKGNKDRKFIKNWRPISLLSSVYKLMSGVIANRLKATLDTVISSTQTGFLSGRQISDNTRLIYDIMQTAEIKNLEGMLMLIDFEKAFDSISWNFMYEV